jgi:hypothetical protein
MACSSSEIPTMTGWANPSGDVRWVGRWNIMLAHRYKRVGVSCSSV